MRNGRIKEDEAADYHIMSRVIDRRRVFDDREKERFRLLMRDVEAFYGVEVTTCSALSNHFHILLHVPEREEVNDPYLPLGFAIYMKNGARRILL